MLKLIAATASLLFLTSYSLTGQIQAPKFGSEVKIMAKDSSYSMKIGLRFQTLFLNSWDISETGSTSTLENYESSFSIRRARLKFNGYAYSPKLTYKIELAVSNRDNGGGGNRDFFNNAANLVLDAAVEWNFIGNMSLWFGQGKMPGNRERLISSGNMKFVDRSMLNSLFSLDRDVGIMLKNKSKIGKMVVKQIVSFSSGEGRNITTRNYGGFDYIAKLEFLPFGEFIEGKSDDYVGSAISQSDTPKLAIAFAFDYNQKAGRERGQLGAFILEPDGNNAVGLDLRTFFADFIFKYKGLSVMGEFVNRSTNTGNPYVFSAFDNTQVIGTYYTGSAINLSVGYMISDGMEISARWTDVNPQEEVASNEQQYTVGFSRFIVGHKLKVQTDITYRAIEDNLDGLIYRVQFDIHF